MEETLEACAPGCKPTASDGNDSSEVNPRHPLNNELELICEEDINDIDIFDPNYNH